MYKYNILYLNLTNKCNLSCKYCYVQQASISMPLDVAMDAIDFLFKQNPSEKKKSICFFGGEPLLEWNTLYACILYTKQCYEKNYDISFSLTTNGILLDEIKIDFLQKNNVKLVVSSDGDENTQNYNRPFHCGKNTYPFIEKNLQLLKNKKYPFTIRQIVYHESANNFYQDFLYLAQFPQRVIFMPDFFHAWNEEEKNNFFQEIKKLSDFYAAIWTQEKTALRIQDFDILIKQHIKLNNNELDQNKYLHFCTCGTPNDHHIAVDPNGNIYTCQDIVNYNFDTPFRIGNIYTGFNTDKQIALYQYLQSNKKCGDCACSDCKALSFCKDSCIIKNYFITKDMVKCPDFQCEYNRYMYDISKNLYNKLKNNKFYINKR